MAEPKTWVACLTPPGAGAIATLGLGGPGAWEVTRKLFRPLSSAQLLPDKPEPGRVRLGRMGEGAADQVVLAVRGAEPRVEIHCHGGREVIRLLLETLASRGAEVCTWPELTQRTTADPLQALAAIALAEARTLRTAAILLDQYNGALRRALSEAVAALDRGDDPAADRMLANLARFSDLGRHLTAPWRVAVAGAPNVGKSSLVNALAGYQRSVVAATPGTTRDVVTALLAVDGWPVEVADTAGLRTEAGSLEAEGIRRAEEEAAAADLCLWVLDVSAPPVWPMLPAGRVQLVVNKVDLPPAWDLDQAAGALRVSARTGAGLAELYRALSAWLVPEAPAPGAAVPFTPSLCDRIEEARRHLATGRRAEARGAVAVVLTCC